MRSSAVACSGEIPLEPDADVLGRRRRDERFAEQGSRFGSARLGGRDGQRKGYGEGKEHDQREAGGVAGTGGFARTSATSLGLTAAP